MDRGAKVASWVAIPILALVLVLAFNLGAPAVLAQLADGVTVFDFQGIALPALADGVEVDLLDLAFPTASISLPDGRLTLSGRLKLVAGGVLPSKVDLIVKYFEADTLVDETTFLLKIKRNGRIERQSFPIPDSTIDAGHHIVIAFMPMGNLPLSRLDLKAQATR